MMCWLRLRQPPPPASFRRGMDESSGWLTASESALMELRRRKQGKGTSRVLETYSLRTPAFINCCNVRDVHEIAVVCAAYSPWQEVHGRMKVCSDSATTAQRNNAHFARCAQPKAGSTLVLLLYCSTRLVNSARTQNKASSTRANIPASEHHHAHTQVPH